MIGSFGLPPIITWEAYSRTTKVIQNYIKQKPKGAVRSRPDEGGGKARSELTAGSSMSPKGAQGTKVQCAKLE